MTKLIAMLCCALALLVGASLATADEKIRIASEGYFPPFNYFDDGGKLAGFDIDIGLALCEKMAANCEFVPEEWDALIPGLLGKKFDVILASMSITAEREKSVSFTIPYYSNMLTFLGRKSSGIRTSDEGLKGKSVGSQRDTISADYLEERYNGVVKIQLFDTQEEAYKKLASGKFDLVLVDNLPAYDWLQTGPGQSHEFVGEFIDINDRIGMAVRKDDNDLRERLNQALIAILEDGTYQAINEKYFPFNIYF
jgi:polar amino acid transport system substrate-binding protein